MALKLRFDASDHCDIDIIKELLFQESDIFISEDAFAAQITEEWNIEEPDPYVSQAVRKIDFSLKQTVSELYHGDMNLFRPLYCWLVGSETEELTEKNIFMVILKIGIRTCGNYARAFYKKLYRSRSGSVSYHEFKKWYFD